MNNSDDESKDDYKGEDDEQENNPKLRCRMYRPKFPKENEVVYVKVVQVHDNGAYVELLEYNNIQGMIMSSEFTRKRTKTVSRLVRVGKQEPSIVLRVDENKGYIDLSKKKVKPVEAKECEERFKMSKTVHSILKQTARRLLEQKFDIDLETLYENIGWPLYDKHEHAYDAFKMAVSDPDKIFEGLDIDPKVREELMTNIKKRMAQHPMKIRADFEITCFTSEGIDAIKAALRAGEAIKDEDLAIKIRLIAPPIYEAVTNTLDKKRGIELIEKALKEVETVIKSKKGNYLIKTAAQVIGAKEEKDIDDLLENLDNKKMSSEEDNNEAMDIEIGVEEQANEEVKSEEEDNA